MCIYEKNIFHHHFMTFFMIRFAIWFIVVKMRYQEEKVMREGDSEKERREGRERGGKVSCVIKRSAN